ncbi:bile acid-CoA:amino acid N-acyltransferase-like [Synchiropus splendidus]|uniref:bile acid-CoA:amino acid N-acyltransferase-like n=1 Tax=Synchiropus splendidus TaxID=270530 RepID=UPI00237EBA39|nr:bile acid-CoA:amino acid N-acyltransferase-like [Synchiropus splendidus]XP_053741940.1 bile acid-CoA:amino acid N-acyltransferase-like [Synchiropus splendidus]
MDRKHCSVKLSAHPSRGLIDEKMVVQVKNAEPFSKLTLYAAHCCEGGYNWESFAHYSSDMTGQVNVSEDPSLGGTYFGVEPMGLLWSLQGVKSNKLGATLRKLDPEIPMKVTISLYSGYQSEGFEDLVPLASVLVERWNIAPGVRIIEIKEDGVNGTLFLPPGPGPFPGIMDLWGYEVGMIKYRAALLGSHGYAALAVNYITPDVTKTTREMVEVDFFEKAFGILQRHPQVLSSRVGIVGLCFGNVIMFKVAAYSNVVKPRCLVCVNGIHMIPPDKTLGEARLYTAQVMRSSVNQETKEIVMRDSLLPVPTDPKLKMDLGRVSCPLLLVAAEDDLGIPSKEAAEDIQAMMQRAGKGDLVKILSYPKAGHILYPPYMPLGNVTVVKGTGVQLWGGEPHPHSCAQEDSWRKTLMFLHKHLCEDVSEN